MGKKRFLLLIALLGSTAHASQTSEKTTHDRFFVEGSVLYWKPHISSLELSAGNSSIIETVADTTTIFMEESDVDPHFQWNFGYRIGAGYQFNSIHWDLAAIWTHFQDSGTKHVKEDSDTINTTKCRVKFNQIDLAFAYHACSCSYMFFKPYVGIRGAIIHEDLKAFLVTDVLFTPSTMATSTRSLDDNQNYHGIGPILGFQETFALGSGVGIYGTAAVGLLYGSYKVHFNDSNISTAPISKSIFSQDKKFLHSFDPNIDLVIGIVWETSIYKHLQLGLDLSFEHHQYFNQSHLGVDRGDLTFDGGAFGIDLKF